MTLAPLPPDQLRLRVDPASLPIVQDSGELAELPLPWIGQDRAAAAARFGLRLQQADYHLFVLGEEGSGRSTLLHQLMLEEAAQRPLPPDLCYLHHFEAPERPLALRLPAGCGRQLRQLMQELVRSLRSELPRRLNAPELKAEGERLGQGAKAAEEADYARLSAFAESHHFALLRDEGRLVFSLRDRKGKPLTASKALGMTREQQAEMEAHEQALRAQIADFLERAREREQELAEGLRALRRRRLEPYVEQQLQALRQALHKQILDWPKFNRYLDQLQQHLLDALALFQGGEPPEEDRLRLLEQLLARLRVNLVVDHQGREGAPVIRDDNPQYRELFGSIEYQSEDDVLVTDFSRVRAGSLLRAHGGFLMLHLRDLMADEQVWEKLRRFLRSGRLQIEEPGAHLAPIAAVSLQPEPVDVELKLVLIASVEDFYLLQEADPEFARRFRCKVDFAESFVASADSYRATAIFVGQRCARLGLPQFSAAALAALIEHSHREAEDQGRQSALFGRSEALLIEAAEAARGRAAQRVEAEDLAVALRSRRQRHNYPEQRLQEAISDGERLLRVGGEAVGQVNGLTVVDLGDYQFGFPIRVTASTHAGEEGLLNIEREVEMSGPIHDKGVLILASHLSALFAHLAPLALNAAVVFEQEYSGVEGDSASCAEFCALLSALAGLPLRQGIALTGALNQHGELLPVGGINEKIEGYYLACQRQGLGGAQGVLIPERNRRHLMLDPELVEAVATGRFHIWTASHAADALELLSGLPYGQPDARGHYPAGSVLGAAQRTLQSYRQLCLAAAGGAAPHPRGPHGQAARGPGGPGGRRRMPPPR